MHSADALFLEHLAQDRRDPAGLGSYGLFCLHTGRAPMAGYLLYRANALRPGDIELLVHLGYARIETGDFACARTSFESVLALAHDHTHANYGLGLCLQHAGEWANAIAAFTRALGEQSGPEALPVLVQLANACHRGGDDDRARRYFASAQRLSPADPAMQLSLGKFLRESGEPAQAMEWIDRCIARDPGEPILILEKARCLRLLGEPTQAMQWLDRLEKRFPGHPESSEEMGNCATDPAQRDRHWIRAIDNWTRSGQFVQAEALADRLLAASPHGASGWNARGILNNVQTRLDAAEADFRQAIACDPSRLDAAANLAMLCENTNRLDEAMAVGEAALPFIDNGERENDAAGVLIALCKVARRQKNVAAERAWLERIDTLDASEPHRISAAFERGRLADQSGDPAAAIAAFARGNAMAHAAWLQQNPGPNQALKGTEYMIDAVRNGLLRRWKPIAGLADFPNIAFLVGFPRSGTTLLNHVLDGHEAIQAMEEKPPGSRLMEAVNDIPGGYPRAVADFDGLDVDWLREIYLRSAAEHGAPDRSRLILDKYPLHTSIAGLLHRVFPQARFVFALRHPCDAVLSCFMQEFRLNNGMANFCTLADTVAMYTRTMDLWQMYRDQLPLNVHTIRYEDVVDDFDGQVQALCGFLGVAWKTNLRAFDTRIPEEGRIRTPSYEQVSQPIYRQARYRWERYRDHLAPFLPALRPYIERFGYANAHRSD